MKKIYISGKITGIEKEALIKFDDVQVYLSTEFITINPMRLKHAHDKTWESYMRECLKALLLCECIYMIEGWENSKGAMIEFNLACDLGMKVIYE